MFAGWAASRGPRGSAGGSGAGGCVRSGSRRVVSVLWRLSLHVVGALCAARVFFKKKRQSPLLLRVLLSLSLAGEQAWRGGEVPGAGDRAAGPVHRAVLGGRGG